MISLNNLEVKPDIFPDKTSQVWNVDVHSLIAGNLKEYHHVEWDFENEAEFIHLAQLVQLIRTESTNEKIKLSISYLPYARQDKLISNETTFALRTFAQLLNFLKIDKIEIFDPHSYVATDLIHRSEAFYVKPILLKLLPDYKVVFFPDNGAQLKYSKVFSAHLKDTVEIYGKKVRNQQTGLIENYVIYGTAHAVNQKVLIIDDICDGGATFCSAAKMLKASGIAQVDLYVSHMINKNVKQKLQDAGITKVFTGQGEI